MELKKYKLGEIAFVTKLAGFEHTKYIQGNCVHNKIDDTYIPLFIGKTIRNGKIDKSFDWYISKDIAYQLPRSFLKKKCLVLPYVGSLGDLAIFDGTYEALLGSNVAKIELNPDCGYTEEFVYYFLKSPYGQSILLKDEQGGIQKNITMESIRNVILPSIDISIQRRIASVLSSLDRKIALNRRINDKLEQIAKRLYDYWFVQFNFPDKNGKPYKSSGGKMVWNEVLKREVPEGWEMKKLGEIENNIITGKTPPTKDEKNFGGNIPFITIDDIRQHKFITKTERTLTSKGAETQCTKYIPVNSLCCSCIGTIGLIGFSTVSSQTNQQINSIVFNSCKNREYIYFSLKQYFLNATVKIGNVFSNMNKEEFSSILIILPPQDLIKAFNAKTLSIFNYQLSIEKETAQLTALRDKLLPLLMNGQVEVEG